MATRAARPRASAATSSDADGPAPLEPLLPWHRQALDALLERVSSGRAPHALLIAGPPGTGKRRFALALCSAVGCEVRATAAAPCGQCRPCRRFIAAAPDHRTLEPEPDKRQILVDQARDMVDFLGLTAQGGAVKTAMVHPAELMHRSAANSLLKTLEEPAGRALLVLVSHAPSQMMATIRSRCELVSLPAPSREEAERWLAQALPSGSPATASAGELEAGALLAISAGRVLEALKLATGGGLASRRAVLDGLLALHSGRGTPGDVAAVWDKTGIDEVLRWLPELCLAVYRARLVAPVVGDAGPSPAQLTDERKAFRTLGQAADLIELASATARIEELRRLRGRASTVNSLLALESVTQGIRAALGGRVPT